MQLSLTVTICQFYKQLQNMKDIYIYILYPQKWTSTVSVILQLFSLPFQNHRDCLTFLEENIKVLHILSRLGCAVLLREFPPSQLQFLC